MKRPDFFRSQLYDKLLLKHISWQSRFWLVFEFSTDGQGNETLPPNWNSERDALAQRLETELGPYWGGRIWRQDVAFRAMQDAIRSSVKEEFGAPESRHRFEVLNSPNPKLVPILRDLRLVEEQE